MFFERSRSFPSATEGFLTADSLSFRGHALLSEDGISWDAGSIEYAWIFEVIIGNIVGKLHPTQVCLPRLLLPINCFKILTFTHPAPFLTVATSSCIDLGCSTASDPLQYPKASRQAAYTEHYTKYQ